MSALDKHLSAHARLAPLLLRLVLGLTFVSHAWRSAFLSTFPTMIRSFVASGLPGWLAYVVFTVELLAGLALLIGFRVRTAAMVLAPIMIGALKLHWSGGPLPVHAASGWHCVALLLALLGALFLAGGGAWAVDREDRAALA